MQPAQSFEPNSGFHRLKTSKSLQRSKVAVSQESRRRRPTWVPSKKDTAQSSTNRRVPAERLNFTFSSVLRPVEYPIDVDILDRLFYVLRGRSSKRIFGVIGRVVDVHEDSVGGFIVEEWGDFAIDRAGDPQQGHFVRERNLAVDIVSQFSTEILKSEGGHTWRNM